jgi:cell division septation protein DedD
LGARSNLMRNIVAAVGLTLMFAAAVWFIIIPKLQSTEPPLNNSAVSAQTDGTRPDGSPNPPQIPASVLNSPAATPPSATSPFPAAPAQESSAPAATVAAAPPAVPQKLEFFRVILSSFATRPEAIHELDTVGQEHPELILHIAHMKLSGSDDLKYVVAVGGVLDRGEAEPLQQRLLKKGLRNAHLERFQR